MVLRLRGRDGGERNPQAPRGTGARAAALLAPYVVIWVPVGIVTWRAALWSGCSGLCGLADGWVSYTLLNAMLALTALVGAAELAAVALRERRGSPAEHANR